MAINGLELIFYQAIGRNKTEAERKTRTPNTFVLCQSLPQSDSALGCRLFHVKMKESGAVVAQPSSGIRRFSSTANGQCEWKGPREGHETDGQTATTGLAGLSGWANPAPESWLHCCQPGLFFPWRGSLETWEGHTKHDDALARRARANMCHWDGGASVFNLVSVSVCIDGTCCLNPEGYSHVPSASDSSHSLQQFASPMPQFCDL